MITYYLDEKLIPLSSDDVPANNSGIIQILSSDEYKEQFHHAAHYPMLSRSLRNIHCCKADVLSDFTTGTFSIPRKGAMDKDKLCFGFCITSTALLFVDDCNFVNPIMKPLCEIAMTDASTPHLLFSFMEYLIKDDSFFLQQFEENLSQMEEELLDKKGDDFNRRIFKIRKTLAILSTYYEQLQDMGEDLRQDILAPENEKQIRLFSLLADRCGRLFSTVQMLKEYSMHNQCCNHSD